MLGIQEATLIGLFISCILYGLYFSLFSVSLYILLRRRSDGRQNRVLLASSALLFIIITFMLALSLANVLDAFVYQGSGDPSTYLATPSYWKSLTLQVLGLFICLFADAILIYRAWLIWSQTWLPMALPIIMFLGSIAMFIYTTVELSWAMTYIQSDAPNLYHGLDAYLSLTLAQNILVTGLIAYRLWRIDSAAAPYRSASTLLPITWIIVESGLLYSSTLLVFLVVNFVDEWVSVIMSAVLYVMIGITFSSVIVRCGLSSWKDSIRTEEASHKMQPLPIPISISRHTDIEIVAEGDVSFTGRSPSTDSLAKRDPAPKETTFGKFDV